MSMNFNDIDFTNSVFSENLLIFPLCLPQVIQRIFYVVNRSWTGRVTMTELRRSNFLQTLALLEEEDDINQITDYFSYEHFYVIYCKFWELDTDHDLYIDPKDLSRYNDHGKNNLKLSTAFSYEVSSHICSFFLPLFSPF